MVIAMIIMLWAPGIFKCPVRLEKGTFVRNILFLVLVTSCSSITVKSIGKTSKYAPKGHQETGIVKYLNTGMDWVIEQRREDAYRAMYESCNGSYQITREGNQTQFQASWSSWDQNYWMIEFKCVPAQKAKVSSLKDEELEKMNLD